MQVVFRYSSYQIESQLNAIYDPIVQLRSGGSIVINQTEALVAIDVNSGKATKERHIEKQQSKPILKPWKKWRARSVCVT